MKTILLCDTEANLSAVLCEYLEDKGFRVLRVDELKLIAETLRVQQVDLILMDIVNPQGNGFSAIRQIRSLDYKQPIVVLSNKSDRTDILRAYELGADDYVQKPCSLEILVAKIKVWLQRTSQPEENREMVFELSGVRFDSRHHMLGEQRITGRENDILQMLCRHEGEVVDRHKILRDIWQQDDEFASRSLCVFITRLRTRLKELDYELILVRGRGYRLVKKEK